MLGSSRLISKQHLARAGLAHPYAVTSGTLSPRGVTTSSQGHGGRNGCPQQCFPGRPDVSPPAVSASSCPEASAERPEHPGDGAEQTSPPGSAATARPRCNTGVNPRHHQLHPWLSLFYKLFSNVSD